MDARSTATPDRSNPGQSVGPDHNVDPDPNKPTPCWCGERNPHYDGDPYRRGCGGSGTLYCRCGGDQCYCHNHGEVECLGCGDCDGFGDSWDDGDEYDDQPDRLNEFGNRLDPYEEPDFPPAHLLVEHRGVCTCADPWEHADVVHRERVTGRKRRAAKRRRIQQQRRAEARWRKEPFPF